MVTSTIKTANKEVAKKEAEKELSTGGKLVLVRNGGREEYTCKGCGKVIPAKTPHWRTGNSPNFKRYHFGHDPLKTPSPLKAEAKPEPKTETKGKAA